MDASERHLSRVQEELFRTYKTLLDTLKSANDRAELALRDADQWQESLRDLEKLLPLVHTHVLSSIYKVEIIRAQSDDDSASAITTNNY